MCWVLCYARVKPLIASSYCETRKLLLATEVGFKVRLLWELEYSSFKMRIIGGICSMTFRSSCKCIKNKQIGLPPNYLCHTLLSSKKVLNNVKAEEKIVIKNLAVKWPGSAGCYANKVECFLQCSALIKPICLL